MIGGHWHWQASKEEERVVSGVYHDREQSTRGSSPFDRPPPLSKATLTNTAEGTICSLSWLPPWVLIACYSSIMTWQGWSPRKWDRTMLPPKLTANWLHLLCSNFMGRLDPHRRMMGLRSFLCLCKALEQAEYLENTKQPNGLQLQK